MSNDCKHREAEAVSSTSRKFDAYVKRLLKSNIKSARDSHIRRNRHIPILPLESLEGFPAPPQIYQVEQTRVFLGDTAVYLRNDRLATVIDSLAERYKKILEMAIILEYSDREIAELMKVSQNTVYQYKADALRSMREGMEAEDGTGI